MSHKLVTLGRLVFFPDQEEDAVAEFDFEGLFSESSESGNPWDKAEDGELGERFQEQLFKSCKWDEDGS